MTFTNPAEERILAAEPLTEDLLNRKLLGGENNKMKAMLDKLPAQANKTAGEFVARNPFKGMETEKVTASQIAALRKLIRFIEESDFTLLEFLAITRVMNELSITVPVLLLDDMVDAMKNSGEDADSPKWKEESDRGLFAGNAALTLLRTNHAMIQETNRAHNMVVMTAQTLLGVLGMSDIFDRFMGLRKG